MSLNTITPLTEYVFKVVSVEQTAVGNDKSAFVCILEYQNPDTLTLADQSYEFVQTEELTELGIAVQPYGVFIINELAPSQSGWDEAGLILKTPGGLLETESVLDDLFVLDTTVTFAAAESEGT